MNCQKEFLFPERGCVAQELGFETVALESGRIACLGCAGDIIDLLEKQNENLQEKSVTDELTGIANYRGLMEKLDIYIEEQNREVPVDLGLSRFDKTKFKRYNDAYGQLAGDKLLQSVAGAIKSRKTDVVARFGGDEFAILSLHPRTAKSAEFKQRLITLKTIRAVNSLPEVVAFNEKYGLMGLPPEERLGMRGHFTIFNRETDDAESFFDRAEPPKAGSPR